MKRIPPALIIVGMILLLGAAGDSDCGTGQYILARAIIGVFMAAVGCIMQHNFIKTRRANRWRATKDLIKI